ncbi:MAG: endolytic transglycosylase MltG [Candidatus Marinimicrobia bacterium]|nr:endolytic transglycosylase MltG [Candidatus Neomarinimicrobiota bacterium]
MIAVITSYCMIVFWHQENPYNRVRVEVPEGAGLSSISNLLVDQKIIRNQKSFLLAARFLGQERNIPAGIFSLRNAESNYSIIQQLIQGVPNVVSVTIIEGLTIPDIAAEFATTLGLDQDKFIALCHDSAFIKTLNLPVNTNLEGFLYPETYRFFESQNENEVIIRLVDEYKKDFSELMKESQTKIGLSELEVITMASIIEGEVIYDEERLIVSAVYHNRLKKRMRLQADPTIQYIIDGPPRRLLTRDLELKSPYNTYRNYGLPIGPINNPGRQSILAALNPAEVDYLYFVAKGDGFHTFSRTQKEHNRAKRQFQRVRWNVARERRKNNQG